MSQLTPNQHRPLNVTQEANHRVFIGLGWDPNEDASVLDKLSEMVGGKKTNHDLDLSCLIYNSKLEAIDMVTALEGERTDKTGKIYHSGDSEEGIGDGDDEQISIELKNLDKEIQHLFFQVTIKSGHKFSEIDTPELRLTDAYTSRDLLNINLSKIENNQKSIFMFMHLYRADDGWSMHYIGEFLENVSQIKPTISKHLEMGFPSSA